MSIRPMIFKNFPNHLFFILVLISLFIETNCKQSNNLTKIDTTQNHKQAFHTFKKQGEVYFLNNNKTIIKEFDVEIAEDEESRQQGLMIREKLDSLQGMLFIFDREEPQAFWMKNTIISLDIIFINANKQIVKIYENPTLLSTESLPSVKPAKYVVEINANLAERFGIKEGLYFDWRRF